MAIGFAIFAVYTLLFHVVIKIFEADFASGVDGAMNCIDAVVYMLVDGFGPMVRYFGVSNYNPMQMELLKRYLGHRLVVNQMQFNPAHTPMIDAGLNVNMTIDAGVMRDGGTIEYCRLNDISMQAWSPFQYGLLEGVFVGSDKYPELNKKLDELAKRYNTTPETIVVAWILRHPAKFQVLSGSMKPARLLHAVAASDITLTKIEWYQIYKSAGNKLP